MALVKNSLLICIYTGSQPSKAAKVTLEENAAGVQLVQSGPTTFCACQKLFAYSLSFDERCVVKGNVLSPLVYISICSAFCKSPVLCISVGKIWSIYCMD